MWSVGCGLGRESVASWGGLGYGYLAGCAGGRVRCTTLVIGLWLDVQIYMMVTIGRRRICAT